MIGMEREKKLYEIEKLVLDFFGGDKRKTIWWFNTSNPMLGNLTPLDMFYVLGKEEKLHEFVKNAIDQNKL